MPCGSLQRDDDDADLGYAHGIPHGILRAYRECGS
jgi:hypothetical protein